MNTLIESAEYFGVVLVFNSAVSQHCKGKQHFTPTEEQIALFTLPGLSSPSVMFSFLKNLNWIHEHPQIWSVTILKTFPLQLHRLHFLRFAFHSSPTWLWFDSHVSVSSNASLLLVQFYWWHIQTRAGCEIKLWVAGENVNLCDKLLPNFYLIK